MLAKKVDTLTKAMEVEAKKMRREVAAMEKEVAAMRVDKAPDSRAKKVSSSRGPAISPLLSSGRCQHSPIPIKNNPFLIYHFENLPSMIWTGLLFLEPVCVTSQVNDGASHILHDKKGKLEKN